MKKNFIMPGILLVLIIVSLSACTPRGAIDTGNDDRINVVCTIFPQYDWLRNIIGEDNENIQLTLLLDHGVDIHSYQPSAADIARVSSCDVFIYIGGESDKWVEDILKEAANKDMKVLNLMELLGDGLREEVIVEGMQEAGHEHSYEHEEGGEHGDETGHMHDGLGYSGEETHEYRGVGVYDEHIWLSLRNAKVICEKLLEVVVDIDATLADTYKSNAYNYISQLEALDRSYQDAVSSGVRDTILFGDRFPFLYLTEDYGLDYYAAFEGCSAETEASFETIAFLAAKVDEEQLPVIFTIDNTNQALARTISENTASRNQQIISLNSMQSVTSNDIASGVTYLSIMDLNLSALVKALN